MNFQCSCDSVDETEMRKISEKNSRTWKALRFWERRCLSMLTITFPADVGFGFDTTGLEETQVRSILSHLMTRPTKTSMLSVELEERRTREKTPSRYLLCQRAYFLLIARYCEGSPPKSIRRCIKDARPPLHHRLSDSPHRLDLEIKRLSLPT